MSVIDGVIKSFSNFMGEPEPEDKIQMEKKLVDEYWNKIKCSEDFQAQNFAKNARRFIDYYEANSTSKTFKQVYGEGASPQEIFCNEFYVNVQTFLPNLYFQNPGVEIESEQENIKRPILDPLTNEPMIDPTTNLPREEVIDGAASAEILQNVINDYYRSLNLKRIARRCIVDALVVGWGWPKFGWVTELSGAETNEIRIEKDDMTAERVNPLNVLVDPEATDPELKDAGYIIFRYFKPTEDIKASKFYKGTKNLKGTSTLQFSGSDKDDKSKLEYKGDLKDIQRNTLWELWDFRRKKVVTFVDGIEAPIREADWLWALKRFPTSPLIFTEGIETILPVPDFKIYENTVIFKSKLRIKMKTLFDRLSRSFFYNKNRMKATEVQAMLDSPTGGAVGVDAKEGESINNLLVNINDFVMNDSYISLQNIIDRDIERYSGISDYQRGLISQAKRTATELLNVTSMQNLRVEIRKDTVVDWLEQCTQIMIELLQNNADTEKLQKITGDDGTKWLPWTKKEIQDFQFNVRIDVGQLAKQNPETKQKEALEYYKTFLANPLANQVDSTKDAMKAFGKKNLQKALNAAEVAKYNAQAQQGAVTAGVGGEIAPSPSTPAQINPAENPALPAQEQLKENLNGIA